MIAFKYGLAKKWFWQPPVDILQGVVWWYVIVINTIIMVQNHQGGNENDFSR